MTEPEDKSGGFLTGWSRRKREAKRQEALDREPEVEERMLTAEAAEDLAYNDSVDADYIAALPSLDEITAGSDIKPFLAKGVPASLKNAAMRKLWSSSPLVRDYVDPAVDYAWDWNAPGGVPGGGGVLSPASVLEMMNGLVGKGIKAADEILAEIAEPSDAHTVTENDSPVAAETVQPVAVRRTDAAERPTTAKPDTSVAKDPDKAAVTPVLPRRHGGAVPE